MKRFVQMLSKGLFEELEDVEPMGDYRPNTIEEFTMELRENYFMFCTMGAYTEWALQQIKKLK
ncbi:MAG: hypothetical protein SOR72_04715 [Hornefia sp.]|nr:hypothetical protein [Hornefia sp.]